MAFDTLSQGQRIRLSQLAEVAAAKFTSSDWMVLGTQTNSLHLIQNHSRLLRSLSFGDDDYEGYAFAMLFEIAEQGDNYHIVTTFIERRYGEPGENISTAPSQSRKITFAPSVFEVPDGSVESDLVAVMSPFSPEFEPVFEAVRSAAQRADLRCLRAKDIWEHQAVIQDIFSLIFRAQIVVCDFTNKNPNVFYEAGVAHALGKLVIPITQSPQDIPFDIQHHRYLRYLNNGEGLKSLSASLTRRFWTLNPERLPRTVSS
jgi:hypothetical protein